MITEARTIRDFVEDMISNCKSDIQILCVARSTHWLSKMDEVKKMIIKVRRKLQLRKM